MMRITLKVVLTTLLTVTLVVTCTIAQAHAYRLKLYGNITTDRYIIFKVRAYVPGQGGIADAPVWVYPCTDTLCPPRGCKPLNVTYTDKRGFALVYIPRYMNVKTWTIASELPGAPGHVDCIIINIATGTVEETTRRFSLELPEYEAAIIGTAILLAIGFIASFLKKR